MGNGDRKGGGGSTEVRERVGEKEVEERPALAHRVDPVATGMASCKLSWPTGPRLASYKKK